MTKLTQEQKTEELSAFARIADQVRQRVTNPRGSRWERVRQARAAYERTGALPPPDLASIDTSTFVSHTFDYDRAHGKLFGIFWNNRLMGLGRTVWQSQAGAAAEFNRYISRVLTMLDEEGCPIFKDEAVTRLLTNKGHLGVKTVTQMLKDGGYLQFRELDIIPVPGKET